MFWNDALNYVWHYRLYPAPEHAPAFFAFCTKARLLWHSATATAIAGAVVALCDRHPVEYETWKKEFAALITQAYSIARSKKAMSDVLWAEYLVNRWLILGTDEAAWALLLRAHHPNEALRTGAQSAINKICFSQDGVAMTDSKGNVIGKVTFEDMRLQMLRIANEFRRFSIEQRRLPFTSIPFSPESQQAQLLQRVAVSGSLTVQ